MMFFSTVKKRLFAESQRGPLRVKVYMVEHSKEREIVLHFYAIGKYGVVKQFATIRYSDVPLIQQLVADADKRIKELMRP